MSPERLKRLKSSIGPSYQKLKPFRENIALLQRHICGPHYGQDNNVDSRPINMLALAHAQYLQNLSSANPQVLCLTHSPELKAAAREMELALNETLMRMHFSDEHKLFVSAAILGVGIMQVGLETVARRMVDEEMLPMTNVFVEAIMLEDFVLDMTANKWTSNQVTFCGHRYRMSLDEIRNNPEFDKEERERVVDREESRNSEKLRAISAGDGELWEKFTDQGELWSIYVPEEREVVTFISSDDGAEGGSKPLRTVKWTGPEHGPYHWFGFSPVLNNVMPLSPASNWFDMDDLLNKLYVECGMAASRQKDLLITSVQGKKEGEDIKKAVSGDIIVSDNPGAAKQISLGGVNQVSLAMAENAKSSTSMVMGNLNAMAGLAQEAGTLGQEKIIKSSSSDVVRAMQVAVNDVTEAIIGDIAFYLHKHPQPQMHLTLDLGNKTKLPITWPLQTDENGMEFDSREGEFDQYKIQIVPYSMQTLTPGERGAKLEQIWQQIILPIVSTGAPPPQGMDVLLRYLSKYYGMPEIAEIFTPAAEMPEQRPMGEGLRKSPVSNRNYTRTSVAGGMTPAAQSQQMQMALLGGGGSRNTPGVGA